MHAFERWMRKHFGATPPIGHRLRADHGERWLRLHSLPGSKRYAETDAERVEILRRASAVASEVLSGTSPAWLVVRSTVEGDDSHQGAFGPTSAFDRVEFVGPSLDEPCVAYAALTTWPDPDFAAMVHAIAEDGPVRAVWFSEKTGEAFAPYDGGFDLVLATRERVASMRRALPQDWLSTREDGL